MVLRLLILVALLVSCAAPSPDDELVDTSVHEWIHALAQCVDGDMDRQHVRGELWADLGGTESVEIQAQASAEIGACL